MFRSGNCSRDGTPTGRNRRHSARTARERSSWAAGRCPASLGRGAKWDARPFPALPPSDSPPSSVDVLSSSLPGHPTYEQVEPVTASCWFAKHDKFISEKIFLQNFFARTGEISPVFGQNAKIDLRFGVKSRIQKRVIADLTQKSRFGTKVHKVGPS